MPNCSIIQAFSTSLKMNGSEPFVEAFAFFPVLAVFVVFFVVAMNTLCHRSCLFFDSRCYQGSVFA